MSNDSSEEKQHQASDVKLSKERDKGRIAKSADLYSVSAALIGIVSFSLLFNYILRHVENIFNASAQSTTFEWEEALNYLSAVVIHEASIIVLPFFCAIIAAVILSNLVYNKGVPISFDPLSPKFERLNPIQGFKNIFGLRGMVGAAQSIVRLTLWISGGITIVWLSFSVIFSIPLCADQCFAAGGYQLSSQLVIYACIILLLVALFDMPIQKALFLKDQKMGNSERKRENKDLYGSPEIKSARRQLRKELESNQKPRQNLKNSTIVIYSRRAAIAIYYAPSGESGPVVTEIVKGGQISDFLERAKGYSIPVYNDEQLVLKIADTPPGNMIDSKHYSNLALAMVQSGAFK